MPTKWIVSLIVVGNLVPALAILLTLWLLPGLLFYPVVLIADGLLFIGARTLAEEYEIPTNRWAIAVLLVAGNIAAAGPFTLLAMNVTPGTAHEMWLAIPWTLVLDFVAVYVGWRAVGVIPQE